MRIFKRKVSKAQRQKGKPPETANWYVAFHDAAADCRRTCPGYRDKAASAALGRMLERLSAWAAGHDEMPADVRRWLDSQPAAMLTRLRGWGLIDGRAVSAGKTLAEHISDYGDHLRAAGKVRQSRQSAARVRKLCDLAGLTYWAEITPSAIQGALAKLCVKVATGESGRPFVQRPMKQRTRNHFLAAAKAFSNWMVADHRASVNPLASLRKGHVTDERQRRAPSVHELQRLIDAAYTGEVYRANGQDIDGPTRAILYRTAVATGLRANELRSLTVADFDFSTRPASVTVKNAYTKNRKPAKVYLPDDLAADLRAFLGHKMPHLPAFFVPYNPAGMVCFDLAAAGIPYDSEAGRFDFHSLRVAYVTAIGRSGASIETVRQLARHSVITTTQRYMKSSDEEKLAALATLPAIVPAVTATAKTGTTDTPDRAGNGAKK